MHGCYRQDQQELLLLQHLLHLLVQEICSCLWWYLLQLVNLVSHLSLLLHLSQLFHLSMHSMMRHQHLTVLVRLVLLMQNLMRHHYPHYPMLLHCRYRYLLLQTKTHLRRCRHQLMRHFLHLQTRRHRLLLLQNLLMQMLHRLILQNYPLLILLLPPRR